MHIFRASKSRVWSQKNSKEPELPNIDGGAKAGIAEKNFLEAGAIKKWPAPQHCLSCMSFHSGSTVHGHIVYLQLLKKY